MSLILLADDSPHARRMGEQILRGEGYEVVCAAGGEDAMRWLTAVHPDVVIADAFLPGLSGAELCGRIRSGARHSRVILTAGSTESLDSAGVHQLGGDGFLRKPFEASVVIATVAPLAQDAAAARGSSTTARSEEIRTLVARKVEEELPRLVDEITRKVLLALAG